MKFKIDENLPAEIGGYLCAAGYDAQTVYDENLQGAPDSILTERAAAEQRVVITMDKGIADIRSLRFGAHAGVVLLRPSEAGRDGFAPDRDLDGVAVSNGLHVPSQPVL